MMYFRIFSLLIVLILCTCASAQQQTYSLKYGDSVQLVTKDSFWYKGIFISQNDSALVLYKPYADNFSILKREITYLRINNQALHKQVHQEVNTNPKQELPIDTIPKPETSYDLDKPRQTPSTNKPRLSVVYPESVQKEQEIKKKLKSNSDNSSDLYNGNYFFSGSAIQLPKNEGYYKGYYGLFHTFHYSPTNNITIGVGSELYTLLNGSPMMLLQAKVTTPIGDNVHIGGSYVFFKFFSPTPTDPIHVATGIFTIGHTKANFSVSSGARIGGTPKPVLAISGYYEPSDNIAFITENLLIPYSANEYYNVYSLGVRWVSNWEMLLEGGLYSNPEIFNAFFGIPYFSAILKY